MFNKKGEVRSSIDHILMKVFKCRLNIFASDFFYRGGRRRDGGYLKIRNKTVETLDNVLAISSQKG